MVSRPTGLVLTSLSAAFWSVTAGLAAQVPGGKVVDRWVTLAEHTEQTSRRAFAACDQDGDDRLNIVEARYSLPGMGEPRDPYGFKALDSNRDGYIDWPEFDHRYRAQTEQGGKFRLRPRRSFELPAAAKKDGGAGDTQAAAKSILGLANQDDDPDMSPAEFGKLLAVLKQPPEMVEFFGLLDKDMSGGLSAGEFATVVSRIPYLKQLAGQISKGTVSVSLDAAGLRRRLAKIHPSLPRWTVQILESGDRNRDGVLDQQELDSGHDKRDGRERRSRR